MCSNQAVLYRMVLPLLRRNEDHHCRGICSGSWGTLRDGRREWLLNFDIDTVINRNAIFVKGVYSHPLLVESVLNFNWEGQLVPEISVGTDAGTRCTRCRCEPEMGPSTQEGIEYNRITLSIARLQHRVPWPSMGLPPMIKWDASWGCFWSSLFVFPNTKQNIFHPVSAPSSCAKLFVCVIGLQDQGGAIILRPGPVPSSPQHLGPGTNGKWNKTIKSLQIPDFWQQATNSSAVNMILIILC